MTDVELFRVELSGGPSQVSFGAGSVPRGVLGVDVATRSIEGVEHSVVQLLLDDDQPGFDAALLDAPLVAELQDPTGDVLAREPFDHDRFRRRLRAEQEAGESVTRGVLVLTGGELPPRWIRLAFLPRALGATRGMTLVVRRSTVAALRAGVDDAHAHGRIGDAERHALLTSIEQRHPGADPTAAADASSVTDAVVPPPWWRDAAIYQIYPRSFADADGDGLGDLGGIRSRLGAVRDLGVDAIWLNPFYPSPQADAGYDVADHCDVDPVFGTLADADRLLAAAHELGLRVLVDLVPNHTSDRHRWFRDALAAAPGSQERSRYVFRPGRGAEGELPPNDWQSVFGGPAWTRTDAPDGSPGEWYLHLFAPEQPDLDWTDAAVRAGFEDILRFWLDRGVDGFRVDVAHGLAKAAELPDLAGRYESAGLAEEGHPHWDQDAVHEVYRSWRRIGDSYPGDRVFVAEAHLASPERLANYVRPDELHTAFNFRFLFAPWDATELRDVIDSSLASHATVGAMPTWVLSNHDVVRVVTRYGGGELGLARARAAALLMLALPGSAYVYQGEELGLPEVEDLPEELLQDPTFLRTGGTERGRDGCRVPLPWEGEHPSFGFSRTGASWLPQPASWGELTHARQGEDPRSTLELYRRALRIRAELRAELPVELSWLDAPDGVLAFGRGPGFLCLVNVEGAELDLAGWLATRGATTDEWRVLVASDAAAASGGRLGAGSAVWLTSA